MKPEPKGVPRESLSGIRGSPVTRLSLDEQSAGGGHPIVGERCEMFLGPPERSAPRLGHSPIHSLRAAPLFALYRSSHAPRR